MTGNEKYVMMNLDDEKLENLAEALNNKTARKIVSYLAEKEASEGDIVKALALKGNTVNYNIKKLLEAGLIEKSSSYFWSVKGRKIPQYKVSKKTIMISPKSSNNVKSILSAFLATGIVAFLIKIYTGKKDIYQVVEGDTVIKSMAELVPYQQPELLLSTNLPEIWIWFFLGGLFALVIYMILNWRRL